MFNQKFIISFGIRFANALLMLLVTLFGVRALGESQFDQFLGSLAVAKLLVFFFGGGAATFLVRDFKSDQESPRDRGNSGCILLVLSTALFISFLIPILTSFTISGSPGSSVAVVGVLSVFMLMSVFGQHILHAVGKPNRGQVPALILAPLLVVVFLMIMEINPNRATAEVLLLQYCASYFLAAIIAVFLLKRSEVFDWSSVKLSGLIDSGKNYLIHCLLAFSSVAAPQMIIMWLSAAQTEGVASLFNFGLQIFNLAALPVIAILAVRSRLLYRAVANSEANRQSKMFWKLWVISVVSILLIGFTLILVPTQLWDLAIPFSKTGALPFILSMLMVQFAGAIMGPTTVFLVALHGERQIFYSGFLGFTSCAVFIIFWSASQTTYDLKFGCVCAFAFSLLPAKIYQLISFLKLRKTYFSMKRVS